MVTNKGCQYTADGRVECCAGQKDAAGKEGFQDAAPKTFMLVHPMINRPWRLGPDRRIRILRDAGGPMVLHVVEDPNVFGSRDQRTVMLCDHGSRDRCVRHSGYVMHAHPFQPHHWDFAWRLSWVKNSVGGAQYVTLWNPYDGRLGGHFVGYDANSDSVLIVRANDPRVIVWKVVAAP
jgi:hypothetical protein